MSVTRWGGRFIRVKNSQQSQKAHWAGARGAERRSRRATDAGAIGKSGAITSAKAIACMESTPCTWQVHSVFDVSGVACPASF